MAAKKTATATSKKKTTTAAKKKATTKKTAPKATKKKTAAKPATEEKVVHPPGIRLVRSRPYLAGIIIRKHGLDAGATEAMVKELDKLYGKPNPTESQFCLKNAHHAIRGAQDAAKGGAK